MVHAFSFCLFGPVGAINNRFENDSGLMTEEVQCIPGGYYDGLEENIRLIERHFPGWRVFVYLADDVPEWFEHHLCSKYPSVIARRTHTLGYETTVHRFFAADEPGVEVVFFRDADSRVHWKDRWAIQNFLSQSESFAHVIRDHPHHTTRIAAGTWGLRHGLLKTSIRSLYEAWQPIHCGSGDASDIRGFGIDQNFLVDVIYPLVLPSLLVTHSNGCIQYGERTIEFPFEWSNDMYVGRVEGKPVTENFWLRELESPPPQLWSIKMPPPFTPPAPPPPPAPAPRVFVWRQVIQNSGI
jgi:hypothetical protein